MLIRNAAAFCDGVFHEHTDVRIENGIVTELGKGLRAGADGEELDAGGRRLLPGFVDVHIHASAGHDTMDGEEHVRALSRFLRTLGVAAFLPTTMSAETAATAEAIAGVRRVMDRPEPDGAAVLGAHMEAPFLAASRCGAQRKECFLDPSAEAFRLLTGGDTGAVRIITMAPEKPGAEAFIRAATAQGIVVSVGHTEADAETTHRAADWGATHVTHTFNAQTPIHHREPGVPGAALTDDRLYCELICDGIHLHPDIIRLAVRAKGPDRILAVTDAMEAAGMPDGIYTLGGQQVTVRAGEARLKDGTLAGSVLTMPHALRSLIRFGIAPETAVKMCTQNPADSIGEKRFGRLRPGLPVPLTLWERDWSRMEVIG